MLIDAGGERYGPYDLVVGADGARSTMRRFLDVRARVHEHRWGALWGIFAGPRRRLHGALDQYFDGAGRMAGFLPTGTGGVSLFWSVRLDRIDGRPRGGGGGVPRRPLLAGARTRRSCELDSMDALLPASYRQVSLPRWHDGQLVLLGDAAHALSPQLGQGANLALMDAAALADAPSLEAFEAARRAQARFYALRRAGAEPRFQSSFEPAAWPRDHLMGPLSRVPGVERLMLRTVSGKMFM